MADPTPAPDPRQRGEAFFRALLEDSSDLITVLDAVGTIRYQSPSVRRMMGYDPAELVGTDGFALVHPEDLEAARAALGRRAADPDIVQTVQYRYRHKDGSWRVLEATGRNCLNAPEVRGIVINSRDVTAKRETEEALRRNEAYFRSLFENSADLVTVLEQDGTIRYESPSVERLLGWKPAELVGHSVFEFVHPDDQPGTGETIERLLEHPGEVFRYNLRFRHRDGSWRDLEGLGRSLLHDPAVRGVVANSRDVTDREETRRALRAQREYLREIIDASPDLIFVKDREGRFVLVNRAVAEAFGGSPDELIGRSAAELSTNPDEAEWIVRTDREVIEHGRSVHIPEEPVTNPRTGVTRWLQTRKVPLFDPAGEPQVLGVAVDITDRVQAVQELRLREQQLRDAQQIARLGSWQVDLATNRTVWSDEQYRLFGLEPGAVEASYEAFLAGVHPDDRDALMKGMDAAVQERSDFRLEFRALWPDGTVRDLHLRGSAVLSPAGEPAQLIGTCQDVTEQKRVEAELIRAKEAAEAANQAKSDFLSSMSHELRTPLNSVIGFANVLRKNKAGNLREQDLGYLERILSNGKHLLSLINDILDLSKIEAGKLDLEIAPVALEGLVRDTLDQLRGAVRDKEVELRIAVPEGLAPLAADAGRLKQVLINLVGNAIKFTDQGSVAVAVGMDERTRRPTHIEVRDTGVGIPPDRLSSIFSAFEQAERGTARRYGGTGLGLAISRSLCELMGYRLEVESTPGEGSTFRVVLHAGAESPTGVSSVPSHPPATRAAEPVLEPPGEFADRLVLVIDDETESRMLLIHHLEELGFRTIAASSGEQGLRMAREFQPDLITLDLLMPGMSGWDILRALKRDPALRDIPAIVVSVIAGEHRGRLMGAVDFLEKPVEREDWIAVLQRHLRPAASRRVLIVDDDPDVRDLLSAYLHEEAVETRTAGNGREALAVLDDFAPDLIVVDLLMPKMGGVELLQHLHRHETYRSIPVVVVTARNLSASEVDNLRQQALAVLNKDVRLEEDLRAVVREIGGRASRASSAGSTADAP